MKQTIQLKAQSGAVLNILLKRDSMCILGTWYKVNMIDAMRLLMNMESQVKRNSEHYNNGVYVYPSEVKWSNPDTYGWED